MYLMLFIIPEGERLAKRLTQKTFADYVIFQNSVVQKQRKQQLKLQEDIFIQLDNLKKIEFFV